MISLLTSWLFLVYIQISFLSSSKKNKEKCEYNCMVLWEVNSGSCVSENMLQATKGYMLSNPGKSFSVGRWCQEIQTSILYLWLPGMWWLWNCKREFLLFPCEILVDVFLFSLMQWWLWELPVSSCECAVPVFPGTKVGMLVQDWRLLAVLQGRRQRLPRGVFLRQGLRPARGWGEMRAGR